MTEAWKACIAIGVGPGLEYPATCHCIRPDQRSIWEQLRDSIW